MIVVEAFGSEDEKIRYLPQDGDSLVLLAFLDRRFKVGDENLEITHVTPARSEPKIFDRFSVYTLAASR